MKLNPYVLVLDHVTYIEKWLVWESGQLVVRCYNVGEREATGFNSAVLGNKQTTKRMVRWLFFSDSMHGILRLQLWKVTKPRT